VLGGQSAPSYARAVRYGNGWYGFSLNPEQTAECLEALRLAAARTQRSRSLGRLEITITPPPGTPLDTDLVRRYGELGVDRLVPYPVVGCADDLVAWLERAGRDLVAHT